MLRNTIIFYYLSPSFFQVGTAPSIPSMAASMDDLYDTNVPLSSAAGGAITVEGSQLKHLADGIALGVDTDVYEIVSLLWTILFLVLIDL